MVTKFDFKNSTLKTRIHYLKTSGDFIASRYHGSYAVYLYSVGSFYAELWVRMDFDTICWIEIADPDKVAQDYVHADLHALGF